MALSASGLGLARFQPVVVGGDEGEPRLPSRITADLRSIASDIREVADDIDPATDEDIGDPDFDGNLALDIDPFSLSRIASQLLDGIQADLDSRKDWEKIAEKAIEFLGLIFEEASGEVSTSGSVSKVWHTLMLEASINFWANAYAEFLPTDGPVKVRDDNATIGHNGGPPLDPVPRDERAEQFETIFNHYLTTIDRQYYRDFSRMLWALGPIGTQFRKVYFNPLRKMVVSEWVKAENLIVSNEAADLMTAGRVTEKIMTRNADVRRLQYMGWWRDVTLGTPQDTPTQIDRVVGQVEGIKPGPDLPADYRHTIYECRCDLDLPGLEHPHGLPLPYKVTIDKDSSQILDIRRNWKEGDEDYKARQSYVMFGMVPGFGFYYLGFAHILGNTERALTALERLQIDAGMYSIFPGFVHAKGTIRADTTVFRLPPGGSLEINLDLKQRLQDVLMAIPYKELSPTVMALTEKLEQNGRKLSATVEMPVGEGKADIPVGTMIAIIEEGTKVMAAVHKGLHQSRTEELELMRDLFAEQPELLTRYTKNPQDRLDEAIDLKDFDLVPASDPNTPSHIHRVMRAIALGQISQMFPDRVNRDKVLETLLQTIRVDDPASFILPAPTGAQPPNPQAIAAQAKVQTTQIQAQSKAQEVAARVQDAAQDRASKERVAAAGEETERMKVAADLQGDVTKLHDSAAERAQDAQMQREGHAQDAGMQRADHAHDVNMQRLNPPAGRMF